MGKNLYVKRNIEILEVSELSQFQCFLVHFFLFFAILHEVMSETLDQWMFCAELHKGMV